MDPPEWWWTLGDRVQGNNGSEWVFVQASTTVTAFMAVAIDNTFKANDLTSALIASNVYSYGIAEFQASNAQPNDYFWALLTAALQLMYLLVQRADRSYIFLRLRQERLLLVLPQTQS